MRRISISLMCALIVLSNVVAQPTNLLPQRHQADPHIPKASQADVKSVPERLKQPRIGPIGPQPRITGITPTDQSGPYGEVGKTMLEISGENFATSAPLDVVVVTPTSEINASQTTGPDTEIIEWNPQPVSQDKLVVFISNDFPGDLCSGLYLIWIASLRNGGWSNPVAIRISHPKKQAMIHSEKFKLFLSAVLVDTYIQISHTSGEFVYGQPKRVKKYLKEQVLMAIEEWKLKQEEDCENKYANNDIAKRACLTKVQEIYRDRTTKIVVPAYKCFVKFGRQLTLFGELPAAIPFEVPNTANGIGFKINYIYCKIGDKTFDASIGNQTINLYLKLVSKQPTLLIELAPDIHFENMRLFLGLRPIVSSDGMLTYEDATVEFQADSLSIYPLLPIACVIINSLIKMEIEKNVKEIFLRADVRSAISIGLMQLIKLFIPYDKIRIIGATISGSDLIVDYYYGCTKTT